MIEPHLLGEHSRILTLGDECVTKKTNLSASTSLSESGKKVFTAIHKEIQEAKPEERASVLSKIRREWYKRTRFLSHRETSALKKELNKKIPQLRI